MCFDASQKPLRNFSAVETCATFSDGAQVSVGRRPTVDERPQIRS
jgi:hypothetical protein